MWPFLVQPSGLFFLLGAVVPSVLADLPVHCLRHQIAGEWEFTVGPSGPARSACGHKRPDSQYGQPPLAFLKSLGPLRRFRVTLQDPATATSQEATGTWSMIYDEGFEVALADHVYFAFSRFDFVSDAAGRQANVSHCDQTQVGWYRDTARKSWGCYHGRKVDPDGYAGAAQGASSVLAAAPDGVADGEEGLLSRQQKQQQRQLQQRQRVRGSAGLGEKASLLAPEAVVSQDRPPPQETLQSSDDGEDSEDASQQQLDAQSPAVMEESVDRAAEAAATPADLFSMPSSYTPWVPGSAGFDRPMPSTWQESVADALNFLQLGWTASAYDMFKGKTPRELNRLAGVRRQRPPARSKQSAPTSLGFSSFLGLGSKLRKVSAGQAFDWRRKDGQNWLEEVVTQGDCGSCYTISTVHMLTARNRIRTNDPKQPSFSGGGSCQISSDCDLGDVRYRAINHHYVGGFYGASDEELIRQELVSNGPLVMSFEPKEDFMYYKNGIYRSGPNKIHQEWEQVDHAVLLIGFGEDSGQPYWTLQNSWGSDWGEGGYFRMARGIDESGCESIAVAADVAQEGSNTVLDDFIAGL